MEKTEVKMAKIKYTPDIAGKMYAYFSSYDGGGAVPSFSKFARLIGTTLSRLLSFRRYKRFNEAYLECNEIRRDYLIDGALAKRLDSSFTKYLIELEFGKDCTEGENEITLRVVE